MEHVHHIENITDEQIRRLAALCLVSKQLAKAGFELDNGDLSFWNQSEINISFVNDKYIVDDTKNVGNKLLKLTKAELILYLEELARSNADYEIIKETFKHFKV